jgi:hypothetical protein
MIAVQCESCGGAIGVKVGKPEPTCLFCGSTALVARDPDADVEQPQHWLGFETDAETAREAFRGFAASSFWYPGAIRNASVELRRLLLPAWSWSGHLEVHWTGLVRAATKSGKRPVSGRDGEYWRRVLIPASATLSVKELTGLGAYDEQKLQPWMDGASSDPVELSELTRSAAEAKAVAEMERRHTKALSDANDLVKVRVATVPDQMEGHPVLVPVWIGVYRHKDVPYRVLVNGQTGEIVGEAPISWMKVALVTLGVVATIALIFALVFTVLD